MGCLPGLIWAYLALFRNRYFVALSKSHGAPDYYLYRGFNEKHTRDMAETIREVAYPG
jgi:hypothetical protein